MNTLISNAATRGFRASTFNLGNAISGTLIINASYPDIRRALNSAQSFVRDGKLQLDKASSIQANYMTELLMILKEVYNGKVLCYVGRNRRAS